jgi:type VI protein secretion system component VasF
MNIEELCDPVITYVCNNWQLAGAGMPPDMDTFRSGVELLMENAKTGAEKDPALARDYARIERPLVFFIDYMVKEGNFPFGGQWRELGRKYNELSGDEKFFNLMTEALQSPDAAGSIPLFYTMLGLGFDGAYKGNPRAVEEAMSRCAAQYAGGLPQLSEEPIVQMPSQKKAKMAKRNWFMRPVRFAVVVSVLFMLIAFAVNLGAFAKAASPYKAALSAAAASAAQKE